MYRVLLRYSTRYPRSMVAAIMVVTVLAVLAIPRIGLRLDGRSLIPAGEERLAASDRAAVTFGLKDIIVVAVVADKGSILTSDGLSRVGGIANALETLPGVARHSVTSITTLPLLVKRGGIIDPEEPIRTTVVDAARLARVKEEVAALGLHNGVFLSRDGRAAAVYAFAENGANREDLIDHVDEIAAKFNGGGFSTHIGGNALAQAELGRSVALDLFVLVPFLLAALMLLLTLVFRTPKAAMLSLAEIGLSLVWTAGLIGALGQPVFITTLVLPVVLIAIGVTDDIYALNRYMTARRKEGHLPNAQIVTEAFEGVSRPITMTALTSMAGLASLAFTNLEPLRIFGLFGALSIGLSTIFTFTIVPAMLMLMPPKLREGSAKSNRRIAKIASRLLALLERFGPRRVVFGAVLLAAGAAAVATNLRIDDSWVANLSPSSRVAEGDRVINQFLAGSTTVELGLTATRGDGFLEPENIALLARVEDTLSSLGRVGAVQSSYSDILRITATLAGQPYEAFRHNVATGRRAITRADIETALTIDESLNRPTLGAYLADTMHSARLTVFVHGADYERLRPVFERTVATIEGLRNDQVTGTPFGDGWISYLTVKMLVEGQIVSIAFASLADLLLVTLLLRSLRVALVAVLPVMVAVLLTFAALVLMGSPLGIASSMFASIALGIGVDYSIHLAVEIRAACARAPSLLVALRRAFAETAPSIIVSAATITVGFGVLLVSSVVPNRMLGLLVIVSLGMCALMTLALVPGLADLLGMWRATRRQREHVAASGVSLSRRRRLPGPLPVVGVVAESTKTGTISGNSTS